MIQKIDAKMVCQVTFMYGSEFFLYLGISFQMFCEEIWTTFDHTTISGMSQPVLHGFRGRGRGRPSILTRNPKSLHVSDCDVFRWRCSFWNVILKQNTVDIAKNRNLPFILPCKRMIKCVLNLENAQKEYLLYCTYTY